MNRNKRITNNGLPMGRIAIEESLNSDIMKKIPKQIVIGDPDGSIRAKIELLAAASPMGKPSIKAIIINLIEEKIGVMMKPQQQQQQYA